MKLAKHVMEKIRKIRDRIVTFIIKETESKSKGGSGLNQVLQRTKEVRMDKEGKEKKKSRGVF